MLSVFWLISDALLLRVFATVCTRDQSFYVDLRYFLRILFYLFSKEMMNAKRVTFLHFINIELQSIARWSRKNMRGKDWDFEIFIPFMNETVEQTT